MFRRNSHVWLPSTEGGGLAADALAVTEASGVWIKTEQYGLLLDANSGLWHVSLGYGDNAAVRAATDAMNRIGGSSLFRRTHPYAEQLADRLCASCHSHNSLVYFATSGSEAIDAAIRMAFAYHFRTGRQRV